ncbi:MAG TPA: hypothetical protein VFD70_07725 [Anaerolineae bacterium]|nr:hypothetical protein [Anaerolineae bacterium]
MWKHSATPLLPRAPQRGVPRHPEHAERIDPRRQDNCPQGICQAPRACSFADGGLHASCPTVLARNDLFTGRYTWTFKIWSPLDADAVTLQYILKRANLFTGLIADTPHPYAPGFNYQRGFQAAPRGIANTAWRVTFLALAQTLTTTQLV